MSTRKRSRRAIRRFIQAVQSEQPNAALADAYVRTATGKLFTQDLRTLLDSEREARRTARRVIHEKLELQRTASVQSRKAAEAAQVLRAVQEQNASLRKALANAGQDEVLYPNTIRALQNTVRELRAENTDLRNTVAELSRKIADPPGSHERWQSLRAELVDLHKQNQDKARDLELVERQRDHALEALKNLRESVRKDTPPPFVSAPGGLTAEDLRKTAEALLPQFLATFYKAGK